MNCPEHLVFKSRWLWVWMYWRDVRRETIPLRIWLNPLRYDVHIVVGSKHFHINPEGRWAWRLPYEARRLLCRIAGHSRTYVIADRSYCERCNQRQGQEQT